jgi:N-acetylglucosamine kinase-like BadF-type ATPase
MTRYVAGLDGGGTKTAVKIADEHGNIVAEFTAGGINFNGLDERAVKESLEGMLAVIAETCHGLEHCAQLCIGAAGVSNPSAAARLEAVVRACGYAGGLLITGDHETALYGALDNPCGMILIAGTGSICYGRNQQGLTHRTGGYGHLIDDEGSGYSIGRQILAAVVKATDGRLAETKLTAMVHDRLKVDSLQRIIAFVYDAATHKKDIAALAPLLTAACLVKDQAALAIAKSSAASLLELVNPVAERLALQQETLVLAGSVLLKSACVETHLRELLAERYPAMRCIKADQDAAAKGAVKMALAQLKPS